MTMRIKVVNDLHHDLHRYSFNFSSNFAASLFIKSSDAIFLLYNQKYMPEAKIEIKINSNCYLGPCMQTLKKFLQETKFTESKYCTFTTP